MATRWLCYVRLCHRDIEKTECQNLAYAKGRILIYLYFVTGVGVETTQHTLQSSKHNPSQVMFLNLFPCILTDRAPGQLS